MNYETLNQIMHKRIKENVEATSLILFGENQTSLEITNQQLYQDIEKYASFFVEHCEVNAIVLLALEHDYFLPVAFLASMYAGTIPCVVPYPSTKTSLESYAKKVLSIQKETSAQIIITSDKYSLSLMEHIEAQIFTVEVIQKQDKIDSIVLPTRKRHDSAFLQFSSGTTGEPKAILFSHDSILNSLTSMAIALQMKANDISVSWAPFYHEMGLILGFLLPLATGGKAILISPFHWIREPEILFHAIFKYRATVSWMPNFGFDVCTRRVDNEKIKDIDLNSLRFLGNGSEPVKEVTLSRFCDRFEAFGFKRDMLLTAYGLAENVVLATTSIPQMGVKVDWISSHSFQEEKIAKPLSTQQDALSFVSCGKTIPQNFLKVVNDKGDSLPPRYVGEIVIKSNSLFVGYYKKPCLTKQVLQDGWLYTGDIGYLADNELYICARKKNIIIVGGQNIYPDNIENIAQEILQENGARVAACGIFDEKIGTETILLVCELREIETNIPENISRQIRARVLEEIGVSLSYIHFVPKGWIVRTTSGKLARKATCEKYLKETKISQKEEILSLEETVKKLFSKHTGIFPKIDDNFWKFSVDSIIFLQIFIALEEKLQQSLPLAKILETPTIAHLVRIIEEAVYCKSQDEAAVTQKYFVTKKSQNNSVFFLKRGIKSFLKNGPVLKQSSLMKYNTGVRVLRIWISLPWTCQYFYQKQILLLQQCKKLIGSNHREFIRQHLLVNSWQKWQSISCTTDTKYCVQCIETIQQNLKTGKGIILLGHHSPLINIFRKYLRTHHKNYFEIGRPNREQKTKNFSQKQAFFTHELYKAQQILKQGGIVFLMGDGLSGKYTLFPFFGKERPFSSGFTFLASTANTIVLPVFAYLSAYRIVIKTLPSLNEKKFSKKELLEEYVKVFCLYWEKNWHLMSSYHLHLFCNGYKKSKDGMNQTHGENKME